MKYALWKNKKIKARKQIKTAVCPFCLEPVIPKCGLIKKHHWAHKCKKRCDPWWENETEWHRLWKDCFPEEFQEIITCNYKTKEKHLSDIKTKYGITIKPQNSPLTRDQQVLREDFFKNMIWLVNAQKYYKNFKNKIHILNKSANHRSYFYMTINPYDIKKSCFPDKWLHSHVPVIFDFGVHGDSFDGEDKQRKWLYCIFPNPLQINELKRTYCGLFITKEEFVYRLINQSFFFPNLELREQEKAKIREQLAQEKHDKIQTEKIKKLQEIQKKIKEEERKKKEEERIKQEKIIEEIRKQREKEAEIEMKRRVELKRERALVISESRRNDPKWIKALSELQNQMQNNTFNPISLDISNEGKITDSNTEKSYNENQCIVLSLVHYQTKPNNKDTEPKDNQKRLTLLLIETDDGIVAATINLTKLIIDNVIYCRNQPKPDNLWNYRVRTIKTGLINNEIQTFFELTGVDIWNKKANEFIRYIDNYFVDNYSKQK